MRRRIPRFTKAGSVDLVRGGLVVGFNELRVLFKNQEDGHTVCLSQNVSNIRSCMDVAKWD